MIYSSFRAEAFKHNTERLVNDLTRTSKSAEEKLEVIKERSDQIIKESSKVKDTLSSIDTQADNLAEVSKRTEEQINVVLVHSKSIFEQSKEIATTQAELSKGQTEIREKIEAGMTHVQESYERLGNGMYKQKKRLDICKRKLKVLVSQCLRRCRTCRAPLMTLGVLLASHWRIRCSYYMDRPRQSMD